MADRRRVLTITADTAKAGWERPDDLWRRVSLLRRVRLRRTIAKHVLPVLQQLESLYLRDHLGASPRLVGKSIGQIEADDIAIEAGLYLFDLALSEGLIAFDGNDSPPDESKPAGSCSMTIEEVRRHYLGMASGLIIKKAGHRAAKREHSLEGMELDGVGGLQTLRLLGRFDPSSIRELSKGLKGRLRMLIEQDTQYLEVLNKCRPIHFLRALRYAHGNNLRVILDWTPDFIEVHLKEEKGVAVLTNIVTAMEEMAERGSSPANIKSVIEDSDLFDKHMTGFLGR